MARGLNVRWPADERLIQWVEAGLSNPEIAAKVARMNRGRQPSSNTVAKRLSRIGAPKREISHADLIPWRLEPQHKRDPIARMLEAESKRRQGFELTAREARLASWLHDLLFPSRGELTFVIAYTPAWGFALYPRDKHDIDIIRAAIRATAYEASPDGQLLSDQP